MNAFATVPGAGDRMRGSFERLAASPAVRRGAFFGGLALFGALWGTLVAISAVGATLLAAAFIACVLCLLDFRVGVMLLIVMVPVSASTLFPHEMFGMTGLNPMNVLLMVTLAVCFMRTATFRGFIPRPLWWLYIVPLVVGGLLGMQHVQEIPAIFRATDMIYFSTPLTYLRDMLLKPLSLVVYALLIGAAVSISKRPERFVSPMLVSVFFMAALAIVLVVISGISLSQLAGTYSRAFFSTLGMHANDLGRLYAVAYALLLFVWDRSENLALKTLLVFAMLAVAAALLLTFSRGAFFGFIVVNVVYLISRRTLKTMALCAVLLPIALMFAPGAMWSRLGMGVGQGADEVTAGRLDEIWVPILPEVLHTPPWGRGLGSVMWTNAMKFEEMFTVTHPHNAYLQVYMDLGLIGAALVIAYWVHTLLGFRKLAKDQRLSPELRGFFEGAAAGLLSYLLAGMSGSSLMPDPSQSFIWLAVGVMYGVHRHLQRAVPAAAPAAEARMAPVPGGA